MTINDMLDAGICFEGTIEVRCYFDENDYDFFRKQKWDSIIHKIPENIRDMDIMFMFSETHEMHGEMMVIEVNGEED